MKIGSIGGGGAGWRRRTPKSGREVGIVRDATTRQSGGVAWRARRRRTACNGAAEAGISSDPQASRLEERVTSATSARDWVPRGGVIISDARITYLSKFRASRVLTYPLRVAVKKVLLLAAVSGLL